MIKRYRIETHLLNYIGIFEMVLDDDYESRANCTLIHMKEMIYRMDKREVIPAEHRTFYERFTEVSALGNSKQDLIPPDFRQHIMCDALCLRFYREDKRIDRTEFLDKQLLLQDAQEWEDQITWWREDKDDDLLTLAGVPLKAKKPKVRKPKKEVAAVA